MSEFEATSTSIDHESLPLGQDTEMFPGLAQELGFDRLRSARVIHPDIFCMGNQSTMTVDGIEYGPGSNHVLPPKIDPELLIPDDVRRLNTASMYMSFVRRGFMVLGGDDHMAVNRDGSNPRTADMAYYEYPSQANSLANLSNLVHRYVGGVIEYPAVSPNTFWMPKDRVVDPGQINEAIDMLLQDDQFKELRDIADAHRERVVKKAKAQRRE